MSGTPESDTYILSEIFLCFRRTVFFHSDINYYIISRNMNISFEILKIIETLKPENRERERKKLIVKIIK